MCARRVVRVRAWQRACLPLIVHQVAVLRPTNGTLRHHSPPSNRIVMIRRYWSPLRALSGIAIRISSCYYIIVVSYWTILRECCCVILERNYPGSLVYRPNIPFHITIVCIQACKLKKKITVCHFFFVIPLSPRYAYLKTIYFHPLSVWVPFSP